MSSQLNRKPQSKGIAQPDTPEVAIASPKLVIDEKNLVSKILDPGQMITIVNLTEHGFLHQCALYSDNPDVGITCDLVQSDGSTYKPWSTHNTFRDLLRLGMGLTPGMIAPINNISPDPAGIPSPSHPYITRYKTTTETDATGEGVAIHGMAFLPQPPIEYSGRITLMITNYSDTQAGIHHFYLMRKIYKD